MDLRHAQVFQQGCTEEAMIRSVSYRMAALLSFLTAPLPALAADRCDVPVWTNTGFHAVNLGLGLQGGLLDDLAKEREIPNLNSKGAVQRMLPSDALFKIAASSDLARTLGEEVNFIRVEKPPTEALADRARKTRSTPSVNACYIEIYFDAVEYQASFAYGSRIIPYLTFKDFRSGKMVKRSDYGREKMPHFTRESPETATVVVREAVQAVFNRLSAKLSKR